MIAELLTRPCTVITPGASGAAGFDDMGDPIPTPEVTTSTVCELQLTAATEVRTGTTVDVQTWSVFLPPDTPVTASSTVVLEDGRRFALDGGPWDVRNPRTGTYSHLEATARLVT